MIHTRIMASLMPKSIYLILLNIVCGEEFEVLRFRHSRGETLCRFRYAQTETALALKQRHDLNMVSVGEHIHQADLFKLIASIEQDPAISGDGQRIA